MAGRAVGMVRSVFHPPEQAEPLRAVLAFDLPGVLPHHLVDPPQLRHRGREEALREFPLLGAGGAP